MTVWVRGGVLRPIEAPTRTGFKLRFPWYEANIAAIMNQLRIFGVKIEGMLSIGCVYREAIAYFDGFGLNRDQVYGLWSLFISEGNFVARDTWLKARLAKPPHRPETDQSRVL
ncbi:hypothetical protein U1701_00855 [Sphingomonas sp. PB2P19]|uniref:hypothetical protein n=1 Tax=Sphingomonas rhamnosi TaxID=3096156 RepID=UPI002FCACE28